MSENNSETQEKSISERLRDIWGQLSRNQRKYVVATQECATKKEAAELVGIQPDTVYRWPSIVDEAVELFSINVEQAVLGVLESAAAKAAMVKAKGLDSTDEKVRQAVATEILDRNLGKPTLRQSINQSNVNIDYKTLTPDQIRQLAKGDDPLSVVARD